MTELPAIALKLYPVYPPSTNLPQTTLEAFMRSIVNRDLSYKFCPEPIGVEPCLDLTSKSKKLRRSFQGLFCYGESYCVAATDIRLNNMIPIFILSHLDNSPYLSSPWHFCNEDFVRCDSFGSVLSTSAVTGLVEPADGCPMDVGALNLTMTRFIYSELPTRVGKSSSVKPTASKMKYVAPTKKYPCKRDEPFRKLRPESSNDSPRRMVTSKNGTDSLPEDCRSCVRYYWLRKFTMLFTPIVGTFSVPMQIWLIIILYYRIVRQFECWLRVQFLQILLHFTGVLWNCVFIICDYHPHKELMFLACMNLFNQFLLFVVSILSFFLAKYCIESRMTAL